MATANPDMDQGAEPLQPQPAQSGKKRGKGKNKSATAIATDGMPGQTSVTTPSESNTGKKKKGGSMPQTEKDKSTDHQDTAKKDKSSKPPQAAQVTKGDKPASCADGSGEQPKSKAQLKAERRAIQEKQRALKEAKKAEGTGGNAPTSAPKKDTSTTSVKSDKGGDSSKKSEGVKPSVRTKRRIDKEERKGLTDEKGWDNKEREMLTRGCKIDDTIFNLGLQYLHHKIVGGDARCVALLTALKQVISKYRTPDEKELCRDLGKNFLTPCIKYINDCRPLSTSMGNAIKHLKQHISQIPQGMEDEKAISILHEVIDNFIYDNIVKAAEAVAVYANNKIDDGDVILIYTASSLIAQVLKYAHEKGNKQFRVIVVEGRPRSEGKTILRYLVKCGIPCSYIYIGSASHAMRETTKVFLGAAAMFAIGDMHSRAGNAMVAALARANNIPVLVCCETYKFTDKVQLSSGNFHQQGRGKELLTIGHRDSVIGQQTDQDPKLMNVMYDVTHSRYITALVTELGMLPCTSVPVVLRRQEDKCL